MPSAREHGQVEDRTATASATHLLCGIDHERAASALVCRRDQGDHAVGKGAVGDGVGQVVVNQDGEQDGLPRGAGEIAGQGA